ncbi:MAG: prepilin-type N-terminal cleavage/methylation domain-containing protein [Pseudomonadota bacterium]
MRRRPDRARCEATGSARGFTLLEVIVALLCFSMVFGILVQILRTGLDRAGSAENTAIASLLAQSQLARVGIEWPLEVGSVEGEADGMRWRTTMQLADAASEDTDLASYRVEVTVAWGEQDSGGEITLSTLRLGPITGVGL